MAHFADGTKTSWAVDVANKYVTQLGEPVWEYPEVGIDQTHISCSDATWPGAACDWHGPLCIGEARIVPPVVVAFASWNWGCMLDGTGAVHCWGEDFLSGQPSDDEMRRIPLAERAVEITAADGSVCARLVGGEVFCWGDRTYGGLGDGVHRWGN